MVDESESAPVAEPLAAEADAPTDPRQDELQHIADVCGPPFPPPVPPFPTHWPDCACPRHREVKS